MDENQELGVTPEEESVETVDTTATQDDVSQETPKTENAELEKIFSKEDVRKIMQKRINRSHQSFYNRYKVKDLQELDDKFALIEQLTNEKSELAGRNQELLDKLAFIENDINPERIEDVKAYFKGRDLIFNDENLKTELATHPEWKNIKKVDNTPKTTIQAMSPTRSVSTEEDESEAVAKMFGLSKLVK